MARQKPNRVTLDFGGRYHLVLTNTIETIGHDDSLPYQTGFALYDNVREVCKGSCWNDGWGGESNLSVESGSIPEEVEQYCTCNFHYDLGKLGLATFNLKDTIDVLAEMYIANKQQMQCKVCSEQTFKKYIAQ